MKELAGKVAVVTGGGSGIGAAIARASAAEAMRVVIGDLDRSRADAVAESIGADAAACQVDVSKPDSVEAFASFAYDTFGAVDLLCLNAGVSPFGRLWEFAPVDWDWLLGVNLRGVTNGIYSFVPRMIAQGGGGHIVNTASSAAMRIDVRLGAYSATKHAVLAITDTLRLELLPYGIGVSALCPGGVNTNISQTGARLSPNDPAAALTEDVTAFIENLDTSTLTILEPEQVASLVLWGVRENLPYIMTAPGGKPAIEQRYQEILAGFDAARQHDPALP